MAEAVRKRHQEKHSEILQSVPRRVAPPPILQGIPRRTQVTYQAAQQIRTSLMRQLESRNPGERERAIGSFARFDPQEAVPLITRALRDPHARVREAAARELGEMNVRNADTLIATFAQMRGQMGGPNVTDVPTEHYNAAVSGLIETLADSDPGVRRRAAEALGRIGDRRALEPLSAMIGRERARGQQADGQIIRASEDAMRGIRAQQQ
jgi:HEAT repeat protein